MQTRFGPVMQLGYVVPDLERAVRHWVQTFGVGPFFLFDHPKFDQLWYRGRPCEADICAAVGYWGDLQVELIQQFNDAPSIYRDFPGSAQGGLQHLAVMVDSLDGEIESLRTRGVEPVQHGNLGEIRFAYVATDQHPGAMLELIEHGAIDQYFATFKAASVHWDGRDPLRSLG